MSVPVEVTVRPILNEIRSEVISAIQEAWADWLASDFNGAWRCKRSRANFVWEQIIERASSALFDHDLVHVIEGHETVKFLVRDTVLFRFKKADEMGRSSNVATQLALAFHDHDCDLFGLPEVQRVEVVYKLNSLETKISDICVVARNGNQVAWEYSLLDAGEVAVPLPMPEPKPERPAAAIVKLKDAADDSKKRQD
ncbi:hypothetical protein SAMN06297129_0796 [Pseudooceanicola antarcticus]|uniref:Uncharacterized protein n=1 Tax=Pseudooceanicola antarcticus TaxID=1247613 RepID=A0A285HZ01_9RHOB|nr:hypothetical protein [Pseudooceanicola antarcticus]PJE30343.1 hypothetical protein CVM39_06440 [Pseudooceanicola antarcticus]SNY40924.1 hypothetical protein SAMN06297129_0796 [Pseudooceanicola antarcticus]